MMPLDPSILMGAQGIQMPDPLRQYGQALTLSSLMDQQTTRRMAMQEQQRNQQTQDAIGQALPGVMQANWSPESMQAAVARDPRVAGALLDALDKKRKSDADVGATNAKAGKDTADARVALLKPIANQAFTLANSPNLDPQMVSGFMQSVAKLGLGDFAPNVRFQDWANPEQARKGLAVLGNSFYEAEKQVSNKEAGRHNIATEGLTGSAQAETARNNLAQNFLTQRGQDSTSGTAAARLAFDRENANKLQHVDVNGQPYAFNPQGGTFSVGRNPDGTPIEGNKPLTETQGNATAFGMRMKSANDIFAQLEKRAGFDASAPQAMLANSAWTNPIAGADAQMARQAKLNFMTASLRKESGAAISTSEYDAEDKKYFPQVGDRPDVIAQKRAARDLALQAIAVQAGPQGTKSITSTSGSAGGRVSVKAPNGTVYEFDSESAAREFKTKVGM